MRELDELLARTGVQYPTTDPASLQRSLVELAALLESEEFYQKLAAYILAEKDQRG